ncbi:ABC transporter permease [Zafaria sp. Z1313]|uniref:ABC transporter permease n=1 Tax=Zafaria sp. Z1313 TaxID=3423202 RepID=UPI003D303918
MSTLTHAAPGAGPRHAPNGKDLTFARILRSEWIKFTTLSSTYVLLACTVAVIVGIALISTWSFGWVLEQAAADPQMAGAVESDPEFATLGATLLSGGISFAQLIIGSLAVMMMSSEFATGTARATFTVAPRRLNVLGAKALIAAVTAFATTVVAMLAAYVAVQPLADRYGIEFDPAGEAFQRQLWIGAAFVVAIALIGLALGTLLRNSAGAIVTLAGLVFVLPMILMAFSADLIVTIRQYLPDAAYGNLIASESFPDAPEQWVSALVLAAWAIVPLVVSALVLRRRDV